MEVFVLLVCQLNKKKDDGNRQRNFIIPIVPVKKKKKTNRLYRQQNFVSVNVPVKINGNKIVITEFLKFYPKSILLTFYGHTN